MTTWKVLLLISLTAFVFMFTAGSSGQMAGRGPARHWGTEAVRTGHEGEPPASRKWTLLFPTHILDQRFASAAVYDAPTNSMIVFAGIGAAGATNDVLSLSNANGT